MRTELAAVDAFVKHVLSDVPLQQDLKVFKDLDPFVVRVVELGAEHGFHFSEDAVRDAMQRNRRAWIERWIQT